MFVKLSLRDDTLELCLQRAILCNQFLSMYRHGMPFSMKLLCIPKQNWSSNSLLLSFLDTVFHCPLSCQFSLQLKHQPLVAESKSNRAMLLNLKFFLRFLEYYRFECSTDCFKTKLVKLKTIFPWSKYSVPTLVLWADICLIVMFSFVPKVSINLVCFK